MRLAVLSVMLRFVLRTSLVASLLAATGLVAGSCRDTGTSTDTRPPSEGTPTPGAGAVGGGTHGDPRTVAGKPDTVPGDAGADASGASGAAAPTAPLAPTDAGPAPEVETQR
jgi:hypothetical protein